MKPINNDIYQRRAGLDKDTCNKLINIMHKEERLGNVGKNIITKVKGSSDNIDTIYDDKQKDVWYFDLKVSNTYLDIVKELEVYLRDTITNYMLSFSKPDTFIKKYLDHTHTFFPYLILGKYDKNKGHINSWHTDRNPGSMRIYNHPHKDNNFILTEPSFVLTTYLNNVTQGGETFFKYNNTKIKATTGTTIIFPTTFPYVHKALKPKVVDKYILTTKLTYDLTGTISSVFNDHTSEKGWVYKRPTTETSGESNYE